MSGMLQDLQYALRQLRKSPGFAVAAVVTLALGIGANSAVFSVVNGVLLKPLPFKDTEHVVMVWNRGPEAAGGERTPLALADLLDWRAHNRGFAEIEAFQGTVFNYIDADSLEQVQAARVTANHFPMLGVHARLGRTFHAEEGQPGAQAGAVLSDRFWRKHFAADPSTVGRPINLSGVPYYVIGVMPAGLDFPSKDVQLWTALPAAQRRWIPWWRCGTSENL
jgi:putative ABC transport system permease protein